mmetsp:Transcript_22952/g.54354  ORF Transcript_22952/g.54354 Transcript_22952/m.54354 type:complete len:295 (+) Transcript_22952:2750-3634(+)
MVGLRQPGLQPRSAMTMNSWALGRTVSPRRAATARPLCPSARSRPCAMPRSPRMRWLRTRRSRRLRSAAGSALPDTTSTTRSVRRALRTLDRGRWAAPPWPTASATQGTPDPQKDRAWRARRARTRVSPGRPRAATAQVDGTRRLRQRRAAAIRATPTHTSSKAPASLAHPSRALRTAATARNCVRATLAIPGPFLGRASRAASARTALTGLACLAPLGRFSLAPEPQCVKPVQLEATTRGQRPSLSVQRVTGRCTLPRRQGAARPTTARSTTGSRNARATASVRASGTRLGAL